jgi:pimeloyl-ACP methyl ester carboxylesterase
MDPVAAIESAPKSKKKRWRWWTWTAAIVLVWIVGTIAGVIPGFLVPPAILEGGTKELIVDAAHYPAGTELVEIPLSDGERLRGVFVPSDPGAPVVLHLLESSGSVVSPQPYTGPCLFTDLADAGYASLMVDYRGVGASDGSRSPTHLEEDARAMWDEALRRAGGDSSLVVVRATSIGTLAAASLAEHDVHPAAWILIAPVRGESVVRHFAQWQYPGFLSRIASTFFRPASSADLVAAVARMGPRLWVHSLDGDELLPADEQSVLRDAVVRAGGSWGVTKKDPAVAMPRTRLRPEPERPKGQTVFITFAAQHVVGSLDGHRLLPDERALLRSVFPNWPDPEALLLDVLSKLPPEFADSNAAARDRLRQLVTTCRSVPALELAIVATNLEDVSIAEPILRQDLRSAHPWLQGLDIQDVSRVLDLSDPSGRLPETSLLDWTRTFHWLLSAEPDVACALEPDHVLALVRSSETEAAEGWDRMHILLNLNGSTGRPYPCCDLWRTLLDERGLSRRDARRQAARILLKAAGIPDRIVQEGDGATRLEIREKDGWRQVDLDWPAPTESSDVAGASAPTPR